MEEATPIIIEAALNGGTPKDRNPNVPRTVDGIVESALACPEAGAAVVHNHNDGPNVGGSGRHASEPHAAAWGRILERYPDAFSTRPTPPAEVRTRTCASVTPT